MHRYENVIVGMFAGHTHNEQLLVSYAEMDDRTRATTVTHIGPSVTTYTRQNPGFAVYEFAWAPERGVTDMVDWASYILDLELANKNGRADWFHEYTASQTYNMTCASHGLRL